MPNENEQRPSGMQLHQPHQLPPDQCPKCGDHRQVELVCKGEYFCSTCSTSWLVVIREGSVAVVVKRGGH